VVVVTTHRGRVFAARHLARLEELFRAVCAEVECELVEFNGDHDHVHLRLTYPPKVAVAKLVNSVKGVSARRLRREFSALERRFWRGHLWSASCFAGSVGPAPLSVVRHEDQQALVGASPRTPIPPRPEGGGLSAKELR